MYLPLNIAINFVIYSISISISGEVPTTKMFFFWFLSCCIYLKFRYVSSSYKPREVYKIFFCSLFSFYRHSRIQRQDAFLVFHKMLNTQLKFPSVQEMIKMSRGQAPQTVGRVCSSQGLAMVEKNKGSVSLQSNFQRDSVNNRLQNLYNKYNTKFSRFRAQNYRNDKPSSEGNDRLKKTSRLQLSDAG